MSGLKDTQNERDHRQVAIDRVGVRSLRFPMRIRDRDRQEQHTVAMVSLAFTGPPVVITHTRSKICSEPSTDR